MPTFSGIDHVSLTVTDLDRSERFYTDVLDFIILMDFGYARIYLHRATGFGLSLVRHPPGDHHEFSERNPGLDHVGLTASTRDELVEWEHRFKEVGVAFSPIRDMPFGAHLNFRDPDNIPLEFYAPNAFMTASLTELRERDVPREEIHSRVLAHLRASGLPESELPDEQSN